MTIASVGQDEENETLVSPMTYEEVRGKPRPTNNHAIVQANLIIEFGRCREFRVQSELSLRLNGRDLTPDVVLYRREMADMRQDIIRRTDPPLVAVEIFSPTQSYQEIMDKVALYLAAGVLSVWVIIPPLRNVTIFTPDGLEHPFTSGVAIDPAIGITADFSAIFS